MCPNSIFLSFPFFQRNTLTKSDHISDVIENVVDETTKKIENLNPAHILEDLEIDHTPPAEVKQKAIALTDTLAEIAKTFEKLENIENLGDIDEFDRKIKTYQVNILWIHNLH